MLVALIIGLDLLILTEHPFILYPAAYISSLGVLSLLIIVFTMLWITIMRTDNTFEHLRQLWLPAASGLTLALLLVLSIDLFRFALTGTWTGFPGVGG
jgi:predicted permease